MTSLREILASHVDSGYLAGAVGLVARGDRVEVAAVGSAGIGGLPPWPGTRSSAWPR